MTESGKLRLLFVCTHNRCRSILAEAVCRAEAGNVFEVRSAGSQPAGEVYPATLAFLQEQGIDTSGLRSQGWDDVADFRPDVVITVCDSAAGEACPLWLGSSIKVHWGLADPSKESDLQAQQALFELVVATLRQRIRGLQQADWQGLTAAEIQAQFQQQAEQ